MPVQTIYLLGTAGVTPNYWGNTQLNGTAPGAANSAFGWQVGKTAVTTPYFRSRLGATAVATVAQAGSFISGATGPTPGTGTGATTASDAFVAGPFSGAFASGTWTFNFNVRASTAGAIGRLNMRVWRSTNANGSSPTSVVAFVNGSQVTLSTTADVNSTFSSNPGALTLNGHYLFFQLEWQEVTAGSSNGSNVFFRIGTASITTANFTPAATGALNSTQDAHTIDADGTLGPVTGALACTETNDTISATGTADQPVALPPITGGIGGVGGPPENPDLNTVLLVHADGMHGGVVFTDRSTYEHRLYPTAATVTTAYAKFGNGAINVPTTSGAGIEVRNQIDFWFTTGQFTLEAWIYFPTTPSTGSKKAIIANWGAGLASWWLGLENTANKLTLYLSADGTAQSVTLDYAVTWAAGTWYHVAVDRDASNVVRLYLDGAVVASTTAATDLFYTLAQNTRIGQDNDGSPFGNVIDEVRVSKGIARYAGAFTPQTEAFPNPTDETVELHIHMEGASGSTSFADFSKFKHSLTASGVSVVNVASVGSAVTGSLSNPTTSSKLIAGDPASFNLGSEPFTIEGWIYPTTAHVAGTTRQIMGQTGAGGFSWWIGLRADNILGFRWSIDGNPDATREIWSFYPDPLPVNTWTHFAMTRDAHGVFRFYCAGIIIHVPPGSGSASDVLYASTAPFTIGANGDSGATDGLPGFYLDELRISRGIARYTNKHDAPGNPHPAVYAPFEDRETIVALLVHADGANGSTTLIDTSQFANTLTSFGGAQITTSNAKFGSGSLSLNGSNQYLSAGFDNLDDFYSERRLTIEAWVNFAVNPSTLGHQQTILSIWGENGDLEWFFGLDTNGDLMFLWGGIPGFYDPRWIVRSPFSPTLNTWYNVAVDKDIETVRLYINGQVVSEFVYSEYDFWKANRATSAPGVGASISGTGMYFFQGLIDEIRYTRDRALYRGPFTPPTTAFLDPGTEAYQQADQTLTGSGTVDAGASAVTGTLAVTESADTIVAAGQVLAGGTLTATEALDGLVSAAVVLVRGTLNATQAGHALTAVARALVNATLTQAQAGQTLAAIGRALVGATLSVTEASDTLTATGSSLVAGGLTVPQAAQTLTGTGSVLSGIVGGVSLSQAPQTLVAAMLVPQAASLNLTQAPQTLLATGGPVARGALAIPQAAHTVAATGAALAGGTLNRPQAAQTVSASGLVAVGGALAVPQAAQTIAAAGSSLVRGTLTAPQAAHTLAATGSVIAGVGGDLILTQAAQTLSGTAIVAVSGAVAAADAPDTFTGAAGPAVAGSLSATQATQSVTARGGPEVGAVLALAQDSQIIVARGLLEIEGALALAETSDRLVSTGLNGAFVTHARVLVMA